MPHQTFARVLFFRLGRRRRFRKATNAPNFFPPIGRILDFFVRAGLDPNQQALKIASTTGATACDQHAPSTMGAKFGGCGEQLPTGNTWDQ
jgi:hypothetical protein